MSITARECTPQEILSNRRHFRVANYQRKYEWSTVQVRELLDDLTESYVLRKTAKDSSYHFLGSFIFQKHADKEDIIDGQQRLTTLSIILAAARDRISEPALKHDIDAYITDSARLRGAAPMKRIEHHRGDEEYFDLYVVRAGAAKALPTGKLEDEQADLMRNNVLTVQGHLDALNGEEELRAFVTHIMERCKAIEIKLDPEDDPFRIFAAVNGRGQPVRRQDVIRVTLIDKATESVAERRRLLRLWDKAEQLLGADNFERYIVLRRYAHTGGFSRNLSFLDDMHVDFADADKIKEYLNRGLALECEAYRSILDRDVNWRHDSRKFPLDNTLYSLSLTAFDEWRPLAVSILTKFRGQPAEALFWLQKLESLVWYWHLDSGGKYDTKDRINRFHSIAKYFRNKPTWVASESNIELIDKERRATLEFLRGRLDEDLPELRSLLLRLEQALRRGAPPTHIGGNFTIEHVLPKGGGGREWATYLGIESNAEIQELSRRLGNLCFVTRALNREMGEQLFDEKKRLAGDARASRSSVMARELCTAKEWRRGTIEDRTNKFVRVLSESLHLSR